MNGIMRKLSLVLSVVCFVCWSVPCRAAESVINDVFTDSVYGGLSGSLVSAAVMAFGKKPGDYLGYIAYGAASGALVGGAAYGLGKAMLEMQNGKVTWSMPALLPDLRDSNSRGQAPFVIMAQLLRGNF